MREDQITIYIKALTSIENPTVTLVTSFQTENKDIWQLYKCEQNGEMYINFYSSDQNMCFQANDEWLKLISSLEEENKKK